jgi:hypothetical protein
MNEPGTSTAVSRTGRDDPPDGIAHYTRDMP